MQWSDDTSIRQDEATQGPRVWSFENLATWCTAGLLLVCAVGLASSLTPFSGASLATPESEVTLTPPVVDVGDVIEGVQTASTAVVNRSAIPIRIVEVRTTCSCSKPAYSGEWIAAGQHSPVTCEWDLRGKAGRIQTFVEVKVNPQGDSDAPSTIALPWRLVANVQPRWWFEPSILNFNSAVAETKTVEIRQKDGLDEVKILSAVASHESLSAAISEENPTVISVNFDPTRWKRPGPASIRVVTDCSQASEKILAVWIRTGAQ